MYDWLEEIRQITRRVGGEKALSLSENGATDEEIKAVEDVLGVSLPASHANFLRRWNGATLQGSRFLSARELVEFAKEWGFRPFAGEIEETEPGENHSYANKPAHFLVFRTFDLGSDVHCFDTRPIENGEFPVCKYDPENELETNLKQRFPNFEALLIYETLDVVSSGDLFEIFADEADEDELTEIEELFGEWESRLQKMLENRGADLSEPAFPDWTNRK